MGLVDFGEEPEWGGVCGTMEGGGTEVAGARQVRYALRNTSMLALNMYALSTSPRLQSVRPMPWTPFIQV